jgi:hypothetical protein
MRRQPVIKPLPERGCHNCRHWKEETEPGDDERSGACRRNPPAAMYDSGEGVWSMWPYSSPEDCCGEHAATLN